MAVTGPEEVEEMDDGLIGKQPWDPGKDYMVGLREGRN